MPKKPNGKRLNERQHCELISSGQRQRQTQKKIQNLRQITIHDMFNHKSWTLAKKCVLINRDAYLSGR